MKKLMIAAAIVCAAVASQAATFNWSTEETVFMPFLKSAIQEGTFNAGTSGSGNKKLEGWIGDGAVVTAVLSFSADNGATWTDTKDVPVTTDSGTISVLTSNALFEKPSDGSTTLKYKIIINGTYTDANDVEWTFVSSAIEDSVTLTSISGYDLPTSVPEKWTFTKAGADPIPEPTSGLLLLLGVAGLALRRRRA